MATGTSKVHCVICSKAKATLRCGGCLQEFSYTHLGDHRKELDKQLEDIEGSRDVFLQTFIDQSQNSKTDILIKQIDEWEYDSITKIKQVAEQARQMLLGKIKEHVHQIETDLKKLTDELRESRQEQDFNETHLHQFQEELKQLTNNLTKLSNISVQKDSTPFVNKIFVDMSGSFAYKQGISNNIPQQPSKADQGMKSTDNNTSASSETISDSPSVSAQSSSFNQEQEEANDPASSAADSKLAKNIHTKLHDPNTVVVDRSDPNSPFFSLTTFQQLNLHPDLLKGIFNMNFQSPSKIQAIALPNLLGNPPRNLIAQSQCGTGKTAAFSIAIISRINPSIQSPQALILVPTFELAIQIGSVIERMAQFLPYIQIAYAVRDSAKLNRTSYVRGQLLPQPIVIGTPGTVEDWCYRKRVIDLSKLHICCVDEADVMIATEGFQETCVKIVHGLNKSNCQMMLFSATYSDEAMLFVREIVQNPVVLRLKRDKQMLTNINQYFINCYDQQQKYDAIVQIYKNLSIGQTMIFCRTKETTRELAVRMANDGHSVRELTETLDIEQRAAVINQFREGLFRVLISTNVTVRGLDIEGVSLVVNYDMPETTTYQPDYETYLRRIGNCGRFGKIGYAFNLIGTEKDFNIMKEIEAYFTHPIREITIEAIAQLQNDQE